MLLWWLRRDYMRYTMRPITKEPWFSWGYIQHADARPGEEALGWFISIKLPSYQYKASELSFDQEPCWHQAVLYYTESLPCPKPNEGRWQWLDVALYE